VADEVKRYGKLTVLPTKMNPDPPMDDELLRKTGESNQALFHLGTNTR
jgi:adenine-specific DNA-methyltransferase